MKTIIAATAVLLTIALFLSLAKTGQAEPKQQTISLSGAWALYPLAVKWGEAYHKLHPEVKFDISAGGAGKGMTDALSGTVDIGMVSRELDKAEKAKGAYPLFVAKDAVFPVVSAKNPALPKLLAKGITIKTFTDIYITTRVSTWKQAVGGPDVPIHLYTRSDACGAASAWAAALGKFKQDDLKGIGVYGDPGLLEAVRRDPLGLGYNNLGFVFTGDKVTNGVVLVPIDANKNGKVDPDEHIDNRDKAYKEILAGRYPASRREYFVTKGKPKGAVLDFIKFTLSEQGVKVLNDVGGYVPLTDAEQKAEGKRL